MVPYNNSILVPLELPSPSQTGLDAAAKVALTYNIPLILLHVIATPYDSPLTPLDFNNPANIPHSITSMVKDAEKQLFEIGAQLSKKHGLPAGFVTKVMVGGVSDQIVQVMEEVLPKWTLIANTGGNGIFSHWFGTISTDLAKLANSPLIFLPDGEIEWVPRNLVYVTKVERENHSGLSSVAGFARKFKSNLHVIEYTDSISPYLIDKRSQKEESLRRFLGLSNMVYSLEKADNLNTVLREKINSDTVDMVAVHHTEQTVFDKILHGDRTKEMVLDTEHPLIVL